MDNLAEKYSYEDLLNNVETDALDVDKEVETEDDTIVDSSESRKLYVDKVDKSTSDLFRMIVEGELNLQPNYQRKFVWDKKTMSKFIESLLLSIPIPTIFLAENNDDTFEVIDGQQRLTTIFAFMKSKLNEVFASQVDDLLLFLLGRRSSFRRRGQVRGQRDSGSKRNPLTAVSLWPLSLPFPT